MQPWLRLCLGTGLWVLGVATAAGFVEGRVGTSGCFAFVDVAFGCCFGIDPAAA